MGIRYRKSFSIGNLFRINLSKSGVGFSFGVKGLRFGKNSRGKKYIRGGAKGFYFDEYIKEKNK